MKIEKYKYLNNGKYIITIDNKEYIIYEDIILKYNIISKTSITKKDLEKYLKDNEYYEAYYKSLKYIKNKLRTKKEIELYLKKSNNNQTIIEKVIKKLEEEKYLNEETYTKAYINDQINLKLTGPLKIKKDLEDLGIAQNIIEKNLQIYTKEISQEKIKGLIIKELKMNNKSMYIFKNKTLIKLLNKGYHKEDIISELEKISFNEKDLYQKEYNKQYEKLSKKYTGKELEYRIKEKLYQKGYKVN